MIISMLILFIKVHAHGYVSNPKPRNHIEKICKNGKTFHFDWNPNWNVCVNHRSWGGNGWHGAKPGEPPVTDDRICSGSNLDNELKSHELEALNKPGNIEAEYVEGSTINLSTIIEANHGGTYGFRLCPDLNNPTEACFKMNHLKFKDGKEWHIVDRPNGDGDYRNFVDEVILPKGFTCDHCILSWRWDGVSERSTFINCVDVKIVGNGSNSGSGNDSTEGSDSANCPKKCGTMCCSETETCQKEKGRMLEGGSGSGFRDKCTSIAETEKPGDTPIAQSGCTSQDSDPWASGSYVECCSGLKSCLKKWVSDREHFYICKPQAEAGCEGEVEYLL